jgi:cellulose synthase/poly-beta-1,6-N-acetylglucosamine synthase-like glycosyltransferase
VPAISVVVPTRDGSRRLPRLMAALAAQDTDDPYEVILVDDGSRDTTPEVLEALSRGSALALRVIRLPSSRGPAAARNAGWRAAAAPVIAFTDDDCAPAPGWLRALVAGLDGADLAQGRTELDPSQDGNRVPFSHFVGVTSESGYYETCNIAYRRATLEQVGGFDEGFRYPFGEDTDLAWRVKAAGGRTVFVPDAVVLHDVVALPYLQHLQRLQRREGLVRALGRHPGLRDDVGLGLFLWPTHPPALAAAAAGAAAIVRPSWPTVAAALAAGAWYAQVCRWNTPKPARRAQWAAVVPMRLAADLYEIAVLARASVRHRTVLL